MIPITDTIQLDDAELEWSYARSGGPGGQNVNKVSSKAIVHWPVANSPSIPMHVRLRFQRLFPTRITTEGILVLSSQRHRDQERNREDCLQKLTDMVREAATLPKPRTASKPTKSSKRRRLADKQHTSDVKQGRRWAGEE